MREDGIGSYRRYLQGDAGALEELVTLYSDTLMRYACCFVHNASAAEDIAEDCFVALILRKKHFSAEAQLRAYLFKVARSKCIDWLRMWNRSSSFDETLLPPTDIERTLEARERERKLYAALASLKREYRDVLYLVYLEGFTVEECTHILRRTKKQIYNLLARAKTALKERLSKEGFSYEILP